MTNASLFSPANPHFFQPLLPGFQSHLKVPVEFFSKHIEGKHKDKTVKLISDSSERTWIVKLEDHRLTDGWKEFAKAHDFRIYDFVVFRHQGQGDMLFHVTAFGTGCCEIQYAPSCSHGKDQEESDEIGESSRREESGLFVTISPTPSSLEIGKQHLPIHFTRANRLNRPRKIILVDKDKVEWSMKLKMDIRTGVMYIMGGKGWRSFCAANEVVAGVSLTLELIRRGKIPLLKCCYKMEQLPFKTKALGHKRARVQRRSQESRSRHSVN